MRRTDLESISGRNYKITLKHLSFKLDIIMHDASEKQLPWRSIGCWHG